MPSYAEGLKRQLVQDRIVEKYGLEAKAEEMDAFAKRYVADQFMQYGMPAPEGGQAAGDGRPHARRPRAGAADARQHRASRS